jgi:hypothetical protein
MPAAHDTWRVLPHEPIEALAENLWRVEGSLEGMDLKRVMTVARRADGRLLIHNGIALEEAAMARLEALGEPAFLVVPNGYHRLDCAAYKARYPGITVLCPAGAREKVAAVVEVGGVYADFPADPDVTLRELEGVGSAEGVLLVRSQDGVTLVFNDLIFNMPHGTGAAGFIFRYLTASTGGPKLTRISRWLVVKDKAAVRRELEALAETPGLRRIIVSHHQTITEDPAGVLRGIAGTL